MKEHKKILKYIFLFFFFLCALLFNFTLNRGDTFANYGFSYAISMGEIPYKDFNMVITPFSPFLYSIGLIINKSILTFYIEQAILLLALFIIIEKLINKKVWLFLLVLLITFPIPFSTTIFPGYNFISFFLLMILVYLEEKKSNDYLIGIIIGLIFCTKQSIGAFLFIPSIYYLFKNIKKFGYRLLGFITPCMVMILFLLITNSFKQFIDLCFLGLLNFGNSNSTIAPFFLLYFSIGIIYLIYRIIRDKKNILNYYFLCFFVVSMPIIDYYHVALFLLGPIFLFIKDLKFNDKYYRVVYPFIALFYVLGIVITIRFIGKPVIANLHNFPLYVVHEKYAKNIIDLDKYLNKQDKEIVFLLRGNENYMFKIMNDQKLTYYDLPNRGNYGYKKEEKIAKEIKHMHDKLFVLDSSLCVEEDEFQQYICKFKDNAKMNSELVKEIGNYEVYYRK